jgi:hypothetical protein
MLRVLGGAALAGGSRPRAAQLGFEGHMASRNGFKMCATLRRVHFMCQAQLAVLPVSYYVSPASPTSFVFRRFNCRVSPPTSHT